LDKELGEKEHENPHKIQSPNKKAMDEQERDLQKEKEDN
jgi:hypothetical protein